MSSCVPGVLVPRTYVLILGGPADLVKGFDVRSRKIIPAGPAGAFETKIARKLDPASYSSKHEEGQSSRSTRSPRAMDLEAQGTQVDRQPARGSAHGI